MFNRQVCRLCVVWTRASSLQDTLAISRVLRLPQLLHQVRTILASHWLTHCQYSPLIGRHTVNTEL